MKNEVARYVEKIDTEIYRKCQRQQRQQAQGQEIPAADRDQRQCQEGSVGGAEQQQARIKCD